MEIIEIIDQFYSEIYKEYEGIKKTVCEKTQFFLDKMSQVYSIEEMSSSEKKEFVSAFNNIKEDKLTDEKYEYVEKERSIGKKKEELMMVELEFDSMVTIVKYLDQRYKDIQRLVSFVEKSDFFSKTYQKNLKTLSDEILDLKKNYEKSFKKKDREELIDGFISKFLKILRNNLFENIYENVYRYSLTIENNSSIVDFKTLIDEFMMKAGFNKYEISSGEMFNSKICSSENPEHTDNSELHKTIKDIIWYPYILTYYAESKQAKKIIKGKVICYSTKI